MEDRKRQVESHIQELQDQNNTPVLSEAMLADIIHHTKEAINVKNIAGCREAIEQYIESVIIWHDRVEVRFKVNIPDEQSDILSPLKIEGKLVELKAEYQKAASLGVLL